MSKVSLIQPTTGSKYRVYFDDRFAFMLYRDELSRLGLHLDMDVTDELLEEINEIIYKRARDKLNKLIYDGDRTRKQIYDIYKRNDYPEEIIQRIIELGTELGFIDDNRYAINYVACYSNRKSAQVIRNDLLNKGVSREYIDNAMADISDDNEMEGLIKLVDKKWPHQGELTYEEKNKLMAYLGRKGYGFELIRRAVESHEDSNP